MIFPDIKESFIHSEFFRNYNNIPNKPLLQYKNIKNYYKNCKNKLKNEIKFKLIEFIDNFIIYNTDDIYLEDFILYLIEEYTFDEIDLELKKMNECIINKIYNLNSIKLLIDNNINDENFIYEHCSPEYYIKKKLEKRNLMENKRMQVFFKKSNMYNDVLKNKIKLNYNVDKYLNRFQNVKKSLKYSADSNDIKYIKKLLKYNIDIHYKNEYLFRYSSKEGYYDIVKFLIEKGVNIHSKNDEAFLLSSYYGHLDIVKLLVEKGVNVRINNNYALIWSSFYGYYDVVEFLIKNGADIHAENECALRNACMKGNILLVSFLVENGANIHIDNDFILFDCIKRKHDNIVRYLINLNIEWYKKYDLKKILY